MPSENDFATLPDGQKLPFCIVLIGMAGTGKSTVGKLLAEMMEWMHVDTDRLLEAYLGSSLKEFKDRAGLADFLLAEEQVISELMLNRCVISTGGSVIYSESGMNRLKSMGPVIFLDATLQTIQKRMSRFSLQSLAIAPGQTLDDLYQERKPLYERYADTVVDTEHLSAHETAEAVHAWVTSRYERIFSGERDQ
ncbi:MAG: homoserine kinase [Desulfovibrionales bacterium]